MSFPKPLGYAVQLSRPKWGLISDLENNRTKWINLGMLILGIGANLATLSLMFFESNPFLAMLLSIFSYTLIGLGVGASGTSLLALMAKHTAERRRPAAAMITWLMMIFGIAVTAGVVGVLLNPYSIELLLRIVAGLTVLTLIVSIISTWKIENNLDKVRRKGVEKVPLLEELKSLWEHSKTRNFTIFVFLSMTAYFMQELILEPYAGIVFQYTPSETTSLSGMQNGGVFIGMLTVGILATALKLGTLKSWVQAGCFGSCFMLISIMLLGQFYSSFPLEFSVIGLGFFNGMFAVAAIGSMMSLAGSGSKSREGTRMGLWGAAQAIAAGFGGLLGTILVDLLQVANLSPVNAYGMVFSLEAGLFVLAAFLASTSITFNKNYGKNIAIPGE
ncbi:BCD family MFS transporter [Rhodobacteraceae bacterium]|nr:BCD family MFS transporter [Paracoccaceae bacterium]